MSIAYEQLLDANPNRALQEGGMYFEGRSAVHQALIKITRKLEDLGIPYTLVGGMALFYHGFRRFTEDVAILVTAEGLRKAHELLEGRGYLPLFVGSKNLRDTEYGVRIEFLVTGDYPGDGKPKPIAFPDPEDVGLERDGIRYMGLRTLIELKLASGMTSAGRLKDLADVQELIRVLELPSNLADELHPFVQEEYRKLWVGVNEGG